MHKKKGKFVSNVRRSTCFNVFIGFITLPVIGETKGILKSMNKIKSYSLSIYYAF